MSAGAYATGAQMGLQIVTGLQEAEMIGYAGKLQEKLNEINAEYAEFDAFEAEKFGMVQAARYETQVNQAIGTAKVANAVNDVDSNFGTAAELEAENRLTGFMNVMDIQAQGRAQARGIRREARMMRLQGAMGSMQTRMNQADAVGGAFVGAAMTGLKAAADNGSFTGYKKSGGGGEGTTIQRNGTWLTEEKWGKK